MVNTIHSSWTRECLTIPEENEEELGQLRLDDREEQHQKQSQLLKLNGKSTTTEKLHDIDDRADLLEIKIEPNAIIMKDANHFDNCQDAGERLSTIYESASPQSQTEEEEIYDDRYDRLIVYDVANIESSEKVEKCY